METHFLILSLAFFFFISLKLLFGKRHSKFNLPPSPARPLPFIGHLHLLKKPLHRTFLSFSQSLGDAPIFSLRLGNHLTVVVSSYSIAEECFTKNDIVLANRPKFILGKHIEYNFTTMTSAPYGDHWRNLRRIGTLEIFSSHKLNGFLSVRKDEIRHLLLRLSKNSQHVCELLLHIKTFYLARKCYNLLICDSAVTVSLYRFIFGHVHVRNVDCRRQKYSIPNEDCEV